LHLVIGAGEFLGQNVSRAMASDVPVIELHSDADDETLADALTGVEVIVNCAETASPSRRLRFRKGSSHFLKRLVEAATRARVRRIVHVSTADVYGPNHFARITDKSIVKPVHAYERLRLAEEDWLLENAGDIEVVILRPARVFGEGEEWMISHLLTAVLHGRVWLPAGGRAQQTFVAAADVGRACLAASDRGRPGHRYLIWVFDSTWRDYLTSAARALGVAAEIASVPYDLAYLRALGVETMTPEGAALWPGIYAVDVIGKPHICDDSHSRRELTWSPSVGSFEQEMPLMAERLMRIPEVAAALAALTAPARATSPPGR
jgi:nucleoside-diphosphate-sugar epimerase